MGNIQKILTGTIYFGREFELVIFKIKSMYLCRHTKSLTLEDFLLQQEHEQTREKKTKYLWCHSPGEAQQDRASRHMPCHFISWLHSCCSILIFIVIIIDWIPSDKEILFLLPKKKEGRWIPRVLKGPRAEDYVVLYHVLSPPWIPTKIKSPCNECQMHKTTTTYNHCCFTNIHKSHGL